MLEQLGIENWKEILEYPGYLVSTTGKVKNLKTQRILKLIPTSKSKKKRYAVSLYGKRIYIHRLVAKAFIPNPQNLPEVNHIDSDPSNNCIQNLEWNTHLQNIRHSYYCGENKKRKMPVRQYSIAGDFKRIWESISEASRHTRISKPCIRHAALGVQQHAGGYKWEFVK